jgi:predicted dehydrogenase
MTAHAAAAAAGALAVGGACWMPVLSTLSSPHQLSLLGSHPGRHQMTRSLRFGLAGTGHWAQITHAPALAATDGVDFTSVWGRNAAAAAELAGRYHATAYPTVPEFLASVDAVAFAVPPDVQAPLAIRAAEAGKHLLLEKPVAIAEADADALASAVEQAGVASVVFFTARFQADVRAWLAEVHATGGWAGGCAVWLGSAVRAGNPFNTPWRRDKGGLWDLAPHLISLLWASLGPVRSVTAQAGLADVIHLILDHEPGATSTVTVTLNAPTSAALTDLFVWGEAGRSAAPVETGQPVTPLRTALTELAASARSGRAGHPCDVRFGREIGRVVAAAQQQIGAHPLAPPRPGLL